MKLDVLNIPLTSLLLDPKFFITLTKQPRLKLLFTCMKGKKKGKSKSKTRNIESLHFPSVVKSSQCKNRYTLNPPSLFVAAIYKNSWHKEKKIR